jgi:hypothetical protein
MGHVIFSFTALPGAHPAAERWLWHCQQTLICGDEPISVLFARTARASTWFAKWASAKYAGWADSQTPNHKVFDGYYGSPFCRLYEQAYDRAARKGRAMRGKLLPLFENCGRRPSKAVLEDGANPGPPDT